MCQNVRHLRYPPLLPLPPLPPHNMTLYTGTYQANKKLTNSFLHKLGIPMRKGKHFHPYVLGRPCFPVIL